MRLVWDGTMFMRDALKEITKTLGETILIVALVVFLFMGSVRTALVPLVAMPVSLVGAAIVMIALGFSLNLLTILAIVLSVGLVVDDAIVVVENVERHVREGKSRIEAALIGARELKGPIIAMTITLATVYTPIAFQGGLTGSLFLEFAITLAAAVVVSGFVALTLSPVMSSRFVHEHGQETRLTLLVNRAFDAVARTYARLLDRALDMRWAHRGDCGLWSRSPPGRCTSTRGRSSRRSRIRATSACSSKRRRIRRSPRPNRDSLNVVRGITGIPGDGVHVVADRGVGRLRRHGGEELEGSRALDRRDVRRGLRRRIAGARAARVPATGSAAADAGSIRRRDDRAERRRARAIARDRRRPCSTPACRAASSCTSTRT